MASAMYKIVQTKEPALWNHPFPSPSSLTNYLQLIAFSDAGFSPLEKHCSVEAGIIIIGKSYARNGPVSAIPIFCGGWVGKCEGRQGPLSDVNLLHWIWRRTCLYGTNPFCMNGGMGSSTTPFLPRRSAVLTTPFQHPKEQESDNLADHSPMRAEFMVNQRLPLISDYEAVFLAPHSSTEVRFVANRLY